MSELLRRIGAEVSYENHTLLINTENCNNPEAPYDLVKTMRASFYVLGPLLFLVYIFHSLRTSIGDRQLIIYGSYYLTKFSRPLSSSNLYKSSHPPI